MRNEILRKRLLKEKIFLYEVYNSDTKKIKQLLSSATPSQINTILNYLHKVCTEHVRMKKTDFDQLVAKKRLIRLRRGVEKKLSLKNALKDKLKSLEFLLDISSTLPLLFRPMFVKENGLGGNPNGAT